MGRCAVAPAGPAASHSSRAAHQRVAPLPPSSTSRDRRATSRCRNPRLADCPPKCPIGDTSERVLESAFRARRSPSRPTRGLGSLRRI
jgi:hypothetical protein